MPSAGCGPTRRSIDLDPDRIGAYGNSAGGHLALLLGMAGKDAGLEGDGPHQEQSSRVQAVVSDSGPIDLLHQYRHDRLAVVVEQVPGRAARRGSGPPRTSGRRRSARIAPGHAPVAA